MKATPMQVVKQQFGGREQLVDQLASMVDRHPDDDSAEDTKKRLNGLSNQKLLRLYRVEQKVRERFGDREKLVAHIIEARREAGHTADDDYRAKLDACTKARLLDITRQRLGDRPAKQTPEQRLAAKRGRKQRERALAKING